MFVEDIGSEFYLYQIIDKQGLDIENTNTTKNNEQSEEKAEEVEDF